MNWLGRPFWLREMGRLLGIFLLGSLLIFGALQAMEGDPVALRMKVPDPTRIAEIRAELGLDDPWAARYARYLVDFVRGEWGVSIVSGRAIMDEVARYLPATLELGLLALILGSLGGVALVLIAAALCSPWLRAASRGLGALGLTVPIYWIGLVLVVIFAVGLGWLPVSGRFDFAQSAPKGTGFLLLDAILRGDGAGWMTAARHLTLPVTTLALYPAALVAGTLDARLQDPRLEQLILALRSRGFGPLRIWGNHVLRLLGAPLVTVVGTNFGALMGGAVLTETVFAWPGMGRFLVDGVINRDVFAIQHGLLLVVLLAAFAVTLADICARALDPSQRASGGQSV